MTVAAKRQWTTAEDDVIRARYAELSADELGQLIGRSGKAIMNRASRLGLTKRDYRPWTAEDDAELLTLYASADAAEVAAEIGRTVQSVRLRATRLGYAKRAEADERMRSMLARVRKTASGIPRQFVPSISDDEAEVLRQSMRDRKRGRNPAISASVVHGYFGDVTTAEQAYLLGLLVADGNVARRHPRFELGLEGADVRLVEWFRDRVSPASNVIARADGQMVVQVTSRQMVADLARFGIVPAKSLSTIWPCTLGELQRPFLCGNFDGDGSAFTDRDRTGRDYPGWNLCSGSEAFLRAAKAYVEETTGVRLQEIQKRRGKNLWQVSVTGIGAVVVSEWMHQDGLGLARKVIPSRMLVHYGLA